MKKLHSFAFYALVTPAITLGTGSVLAEQSTGKDIDGEKLSTQSTERGQGAGRSDSYPGGDRQNMHMQSHVQNRGYIDSAPANGMQASSLIGTEVKTTGDENVGSVSDLIINENGQVVAVVVGVGGFLAMGEKDVAIGWDRVTASGTADKQELRVDVSREDLQSAPEFKTRD